MIGDFSITPSHGIYQRFLAERWFLLLQRQCDVNHLVYPSATRGTEAAKFSTTYESSTDGNNFREITSFIFNLIGIVAMLVKMRALSLALGVGIGRPLVRQPIPPVHGGVRRQTTNRPAAGDSNKGMNRSTCASHKSQRATPQSRTESANVSHRSAVMFGGITAIVCVVYFTMLARPKAAVKASEQGVNTPSTDEQAKIAQRATRTPPAR